MAKRPYNAQDPRGYTVLLYDEQYDKHIGGRHPEAEVECVLIVIEKPDFITDDINYKSRENYYARGVIPDVPNLFLKVCVETEGGTRKVVTSFETDRPKPKENVLWRP